MNRRDILVATLGSGATALLPAAARAQGSGSGDARLLAAADRIFREGKTDSPQSATSEGRDVGANAILRHRLNDRSQMASARRLARAKAAVVELEAVDPQTLSPPFVLYREVTLYGQRALTVGPERFGIDDAQYPFVITQRYGAYISIPEFLDKNHPIGTAGDAEAYLDRVRSFATALDQDSERQASQAARGYLAPVFILDTTLGQIAALRAPPGADNRLTRSIVRRTASAIPGDWNARWPRSSRGTSIRRSTARSR